VFVENEGASSKNVYGVTEHLSNVNKGYGMNDRLMKGAGAGMIISLFMMSWYFLKMIFILLQMAGGRSASIGKKDDDQYWRT